MNLIRFSFSLRCRFDVSSSGDFPQPLILRSTKVKNGAPSGDETIDLERTGNENSSYFSSCFHVDRLYLTSSRAHHDLCFPGSHDSDSHLQTGV